MSVESTADLVGQVRDEWGVDATDPQIVSALNARHRRMVARSRCYRRDVALGPTVAGQEAYSTPVELVEIYLLAVDGVPWGPSRFEDFRAIKAGVLGYRLSGSGGVFVQNASASAVEQVLLYPAPTVSGLEVLAWAAVRAPELAIDGQGPVTPAEFNEDLAAGAAGVLLRRVEQRFDLADSLDGRFDQACEELRRQVERRYGTRVRRIPVRWET